MATTMVNGMTNADGNSTINSVSGPEKQQAKANAGLKGGDASRKPAGPSNDGTQR